MLCVLLNTFDHYVIPSLMKNWSVTSGHSFFVQTDCFNMSCVLFKSIITKVSYKLIRSYNENPVLVGMPRFIKTLFDLFIL